VLTVNMCQQRGESTRSGRLAHAACGEDTENVQLSAFVASSVEFFVKLCDNSRRHTDNSANRND
jgi:hypothetical protein